MDGTLFLCVPTRPFFKFRAPTLELKSLKPWLIILFFIPAVAGAADLPANEDPVITLSTERVAVGATLIVSIDSQTPLIDLKLQFGDMDGHFFRPPGARSSLLAALVAIPFKSRPGPRALSVRWKQSGQPRQRLLAFTAVRGAYRSENLKVNPSKVNPNKKNQQRAAREAREVRRIYDAASSQPDWDAAFQKPLASVVTSPYGNRRLFNGELASYHTGIDFRAPPGTPVQAANRGTIRLAKNLFYAGNTVLIEHGAGVFTIYAHLSEMGVTTGQPVERGQMIGWSGQSGRVSGPHLHWGVKLNGQNVDPFQFLAAISKLAP